MERVGPLLEVDYNDEEQARVNLRDEVEGTDDHSSAGPLVLQGPRQEDANQTFVGKGREGPLLEQDEGEHLVAGDNPGENDREGGGARDSSTGPLLLPSKGPTMDDDRHTLVPYDRGGQGEEVPDPSTLLLGGEGGIPVTKDVGNTDGGSLYDTASNVLRLREDRGECEVRRGMCVKHGRRATKITTNKRVWTKVKKTGLFKYCTRKMSVWRCDVNTPTLVGTMGPGESAGADCQTGS